MDADLTLADGVCLCLVVTPLDTTPTHGWQLVRELAPGGAIGSIWSLSRPLTYRSLANLESNGLVERDRSNPNERRQPITATDRGRRACRHWLDQPAEHIRDLRTLFLVKCELRKRAGLSVAEFADRQRSQLADALDTLAAADEDHNDIVGLWRRHSAQAAQRALEALAGNSTQRPELR